MTGVNVTTKDFARRRPVVEAELRVLERDGKLRNAAHVMTRVLVVLGLGKRAYTLGEWASQLDNS
jgi:hypothetical protein